VSGQNNSKKPNLPGAIFAVIFMVYWNYLAISGGASFMAVLFGLFGLFIACRSAVHQYKLMKQNRNNGYGGDYGGQYGDYGSYNTPTESLDPWDKNFRGDSQEFDIDPNCGHIHSVQGNSVNFCPYCGEKTEQVYDFCPKCGRQLPD